MQVVEIVTLQLVLVLYHRAHFNLGYAEFHQTVILVNAFLVDHAPLHLRLHHLAAFHVVGCGFQSGHVFPLLLAFRHSEGYALVGHALTVGLQHLQASFHAIIDMEPVAHKGVIDIGQPVEFHNVGIGIGCIGRHRQFLLSRFPPFQVGLQLLCHYVLYGQ